jgi:hypothetical protein
MRNAYTVFGGTREEKIPVGRTRLVWENNNKLSRKETGREDVCWNHLSQDRDHRWVLLITIINLKGP